MKTSGGVDVTTTSQVLIPEWSSRRELTITNGDATAIVAIGLREANGPDLPVDPEAVLGDGIPLAPGASWTTTGYYGPVALIADGACRVAVVEF